MRVWPHPFPRFFLFLTYKVEVFASPAVKKFAKPHTLFSVFLVKLFHCKIS